MREPGPQDLLDGEPTSSPFAVSSSTTERASGFGRSASDTHLQDHEQTETATQPHAIRDAKPAVQVGRRRKRTQQDRWQAQLNRQTDSPGEVPIDGDEHEALAALLLARLQLSGHRHAQRRLGRQAVQHVLQRAGLREQPSDSTEQGERMNTQVVTNST